MPASIAGLTGKPNLHDNQFVDTTLPAGQSVDRELQPVTSGELTPDRLQPYDAGQMETYMVSRIVNSPKNDKAECIEPVHE